VQARLYDVYGQKLDLEEIRRHAVSTPKEQMVETINDQPDDSSYDEILRELAFKRMVDKGLADARSGRTVSNEEVSRRIRTWQK
jgi:predicted transcriptional regulator